MPYLALSIDMRERTALIVGGGKVAARKLQVLRNAGAHVRIVAPALLPEVSALATDGTIAVRIGTYETSDLEGITLVVAATDNGDVNLRVALEARARGLLVSVADQPEEGDCHFPAMLRRGGLEIAVATGGRCPVFASEVRDIIATMIGDGYGDALEQLAVEREKLLTEGNGNTYNKEVLRSRARRLIVEFSERKDIP